jgi:TPR repeat protein
VAVRWFELSVKQGHRSGQLRLGRMYAEGRGGLPKDEAKAMELFRLAAAQGDADAKLELDQRELGKRE